MVRPDNQKLRAISIRNLFDLNSYTKYEFCASIDEIRAKLIEKGHDLNRVVFVYTTDFEFCEIQGDHE